LTDDANPTGYSQVLEVRTAQASQNDLDASQALASATPDTYILGLDAQGQWTSAASVLSYFVYDGHMSVRGLVDGAGAIDSTQVYDYDAFGNAKGFLPDTAKSSLLYVGEWWDVPAAGYDNRARIYLPGSGRFNARDSFEGTVDDPRTLHRYKVSAT
jgi:RHS repeat-associated protein